MTNKSHVPKWKDAYYYYKWLLIPRNGLTSVRGRFDRYLRRYVRATGMHLPLELRFSQLDQSPKGTIRYRRADEES